MTAQSEASSHNAITNLAVDHDWLARSDEDVLDPELPIVDPHHHLWQRPGATYGIADLLADIGDGHRVIATVNIEAGAHYRSEGPAELRPVGETDAVARMAASAGDTVTDVCAAIVGFVDLMAPSEVDAVLDAHEDAAGGRFAGIRQITAWDACPDVQMAQAPPRPALSSGMLLDPRFREGFARLARRNLSFDAWLYHTQLSELTDLACAFPESTIVVNHLGGLLRVGPYAAKHEEAFAAWSAAMGELSRLPNVYVKVGGLGMRMFGLDLRDRPAPPDSAELARVWRRFVEPVIELFGADRCMFESNFPVDKAYYTYRAGWNAFKRLAGAASESERRALFADTAARVYGLPPALLQHLPERSVDTARPTAR